MSGCDFCESDEFTSLLRRDWAVRVLDAWAWKTHGNRWTCRNLSDDTGLDFVANLWCDAEESEGEWSAESADAARHAAALAVFRTLPESVRAELGECP